MTTTITSIYQQLLDEQQAASFTLINDDVKPNDKLLFEGYIDGLSMAMEALEELPEVNEWNLERLSQIKWVVDETAPMDTDIDIFTGLPTSSAVGDKQKYIDLAETLNTEYNEEFVMMVNEGEYDDWIDSTWWEK